MGAQYPLASAQGEGLPRGWWGRGGADRGAPRRRARQGESWHSCVLERISLPSRVSPAEATPLLRLGVAATTHPLFLHPPPPAGHPGGVPGHPRGRGGGQGREQQLPPLLLQLPPPLQVTQEVYLGILGAEAKVGAIHPPLLLHPPPL